MTISRDMKVTYRAIISPRCRRLQLAEPSVHGKDLLGHGTGPRSRRDAAHHPLLRGSGADLAAAVRQILILRGKRLGFSLRDIKEYLDLYVVDTTQSEQLQHLVKKARERITQLEGQLQAVKTTLQELRDIERVSLETLSSRGLSAETA